MMEHHNWSSFRVLDGEDIEGWIGMESVLFGTSVSLQTQEQLISNINCAEWSTEIKFIKKKSKVTIVP